MKKTHAFLKQSYAQLMVFALMLFLPINLITGQTTVFTDNFNRDLGVTPLTNGGTPTMTWTAATTASSASVYTTNAATVDPTNYVLQIYTGGTAAAGRSYVTGPLSTYSSPFASTLSSNTGNITWTFNMKTNRSTALSGFDSGNYGSAVILAMTSANPANTSTNGYAVVLVKGTTNNAVKLVRFANGLVLNSNVTTIIGPSSDLGAMTRYVSVKVVYVPSTNTWSLYYRDDASTTDPTDPTTGTLTQVGSNTVNSTYTSSTMTSCGFMWNHSNGAGSSNKAMYDNFKVQVTLTAPVYTLGWPKAEGATQTGFTAKVNSSSAGNSYYVIVPNGASAPTSAQVKAGQDASGTPVADNLKGTIACAAGATEYTSVVSGLTGNTTYDVYFVAEDAVPNLQAAPTKVSVTTTPAINWVSGWPKAETPTPSGFTAKVKTNVAGTSYYVVLASGATAPSSAQVKAGQDASSSAAIAGGSISCVAGNTEYTTAVSGLTGGTNYDVYYVAEDGSAILQASPTLVTVTTTSSALAPTISDPTVIAITNNSATLGGNISSDGGSAITERGTVWKASAGVTISDNLLAEGGTSTGIFTQSRSSLPQKTQVFYKAYAINAIGTSLSSEGNFYTLANEPTVQVTDLVATATSATAINLTWTAAAGVDGYIILQKLGASAPTGVPTDATTYTVGNTIGDGTVAAILTSGATTSQSITGLTASTSYSFVVIAVNSDGTNAQTYNYYTSSIPTSTATTQAPPAATYVWNQTGTASFATAANWTPERTTPATNDILQFNGGVSVVATGLTTQTIGQLQISNNTTVELQSAATATLTIAGSTGVDLDIQSGSALNVAQATNVITIAVATGATGSISGSISYSTAPHKLTAADASGITFQNGATFTAGLLFSSNAFGTTSLNSVVFASGSKYYSIAGANPFGATAPNSVVVWQTGSTYVQKNTGSPATANRTYANFELDEATGANYTGSSPFTIDNLIVKTGSWGLGIKNNFTINGNISVASGATLSLNPTTAGTIIFAGSSPQTITNNGTLSNNSFQSFSVTNVNPLVINNNLGASLTSTGTLPGTLNNAGTFNLSGASTTLGGTINLLITNATTSGTVKAPTSGSIDVSGVTLNVTLDAGYTPVDQDNVVLFSVPSGTITGNFASTSLPSFKWSLSNSSGVVSTKYDNTTDIYNLSSTNICSTFDGKLIVFANCEVYNSLGMKVASVKSSAKNTTLSLRSGVYIVKSGNYTQKVLIK
jgi:hypothetical protein